MLGTVRVHGQITGGDYDSGLTRSIVADHGIGPAWTASFGDIGLIAGSSLAGTITFANQIGAIRAKDDLAMSISTYGIGDISASRISGGTIESHMLYIMELEYDPTALGLIRSIRVADGMSGNWIIAHAIGSLRVGGAVSNAKVQLVDAIGVVDVGSIADSSIATGVPWSTDYYSPRNSIGRFVTHDGGGFSNTTITAQTFGSVLIHGATATTAGGITATNIAMLTFDQPGEPAVSFTTRKASATVPSLLGTDFVIQIKPAANGGG
jgi:hypothetical protein